MLPADAGSGGPAAPRRGRLRRFINRLEVDQAVFYSLCLRCWQFVTGPISVLMTGYFFSPDTQGYFYTFSSLMALQSFFELGFHIVIINVASHEWLHLDLDSSGRIVGAADAQSRLASLGRLLVRWYGVAALLFALIVGCGGMWFLGRKDYGPMDWQGPWILLVLLTAGLLWDVPLVVLLEGCGQLVVVNRFRVYQAVTGSLTVWTCMALGLGLWTAVISSGLRLAWELGLLFVRYRRFFAAFWRAPAGPQLSWRHDLWPMQWRLAVSGIFSYFATNLLTPVMFHYHGPTVAGQMGMTWQFVTMLQGVALSWVQARAPLFGRLVARRDYRELDRVFDRLTWISSGVAALGAVGLVLCVWALSAVDFWLAHRLLAPLPTALLLLAIVVYHFPQCQAFYIRAHKREPLFVLSIISSVLIGGGVWWWGRQYGPLGASTAYLAIVACIILPWQSLIWWSYRASHGQSPQTTD
jgi:O-antigen/teichoic acid export membrane protein